MRPTYNLHKTWQENYDSGPEFAPAPPQLRAVAPKYDFCGLPLRAPIGVGAGLLWNGRWLELYARLGYSLLTTKTVRTRRVDGHAFPQLLAVAEVQGHDPPQSVVALEDADLLSQRAALVNSFGNPYVEPEQWVPDFAQAKKSLTSGRHLCISITGTLEEGDDLDAFARDAAHCARLALSAGADALEVNLSCPNVANPAENLYQDPGAAALVLSAVRAATPQLPLFVKVGRFANRAGASEFIAAAAPYFDALTAINSEPVRALNAQGESAFPGRAMAGLAGRPLKPFALAQVKMLDDLRRAGGYTFKLIGLGGVTCAQDFFDMRAAGADVVEAVTGAMVNPLLAQEIETELQRRERVG